MPDARSMTEMGLNTAMMFAFAIPGGEVVGAALAVAELMVGLLWEDRAIPPEEQPVTVAAFNAALDDLRTEIRQILTDSKRLDDTANILALTKLLHANWAAVLSVQTISDRLHNFEAYDFVQDDSTTAFVAAIGRYFHESCTKTTAAAVLSSVKFEATAKNALELQNRNFALFMFTGSLITGYLKAAVAWEWANEILGVRKYNAYVIANREWKKNPDPNHPELEPVAPEDSEQSIPSWQEWKAEAGSPVQPLIDQVNELLGYAEDTLDSKGVYTKMAKNWQDRLAKTTERVGKFSLTNGNLSVLDAETGHQAGPFATQAQAAAVQDVMTGSQIAYEWESRTRDGQLDFVNDGDVESWGRAIGEWKKIRDSVKFRTFPWGASDTADKTIPGYYSDDKRGDRIFAANRDKIPSIRSLTPGSQLTIPSLDGATAPATYTVKAGDQLDAVGKSCYPDAALTAWILEVNKSKLTGQPPAFQEGAVLKYPDLA